MIALPAFIVALALFVVASLMSSRINQLEDRIEEQEQRERYRRALRILRAIPSGTADVELTLEQRQAWKDHDEALAWLQSRWQS